MASRHSSSCLCTRSQRGSRVSLPHPWQTPQIASGYPCCRISPLPPQGGHSGAFINSSNSPLVSKRQEQPRTRQRTVIAVLTAGPAS